MKMWMGKGRERLRAMARAKYKLILSLDGKDLRMSWQLYQAKHLIFCRKEPKELILRQLWLHCVSVSSGNAVHLSDRILSSATARKINYNYCVLLRWVHVHRNCCSA